MTPIEGYKLAKQDIVDYVASGRQLIGGELRLRGKEHCALGVLYVAAGVWSPVTDQQAREALEARFDGALFMGLTIVNDCGPQSQRLERVLVFMDSKIQAANKGSSLP